MGKPTGFLELERQDRKYAPVADRITHYNEFVIDLSDEELSNQGARCMDCGIPFCHWGCPVDNLIPEWNDLLYKGDWRGASERLHHTNNFPEFTGRICPAPCEEACVLGINEDPVTIEQIEKEIKKHLESTDGVAAIKIIGGLEEQIRIEIDEKRLAELGVPITEVTNILRQENLNQAGGSLYEAEARYLVRARNEFRSLDDIRETVRQAYSQVAKTEGGCCGLCGDRQFLALPDGTGRAADRARSEPGRD